MFVVEESTYLEHFGVKGMKWGVRKAHSTKTPQQKSTRNKKVAIIAGVSSVAIGAAFLSVWLKKNGQKKPFDYGFGDLAKDALGNVLDPQPHKVTF